MNQMPLDLQPVPEVYRKLEYGTPVYRDEHGEYCLIALTQGQVTQVDVGDYHWLMQWKWYARYSKSNGEFRAGRSFKTPDGKSGTVLMARAIVNASGDIKVDHHDHHVLNNRRYNLRPATHGQNACNRVLYKNNSSGLKGVSFKRSNNAWQAAIRFQNKTIYLGLYETPEKAHAAYQRAALKLHGEFACMG